MSFLNNHIEEKPPHSKIFIIFHKDQSKVCEQDFREIFEPFGNIESIHIPRDRNTGESRGMAYIKYSKTSSAASAIDKMHLKPLGNKPMKVLLATNRNDKNDNTAEKYSRLFIKITKQATIEEIREHFSQFATVDDVYIQKDKSTQESKGLAYVQFKTFLDAAKAFENCDNSYKAVFATPKQELKRGRSAFHEPFKSDFVNDHFTEVSSVKPGISSMINTMPQNYKSICVTCTPALNERHIEKLFNIIPGLQSCKFSLDSYNGYSRSIITYEDERSAAYAVEKLNNYEFPSGEILTVKPNNALSKAAENLTMIVNSFKNAIDTNRPDLMQLANAIAQASTVIKAASLEKGKVLEPTVNCSVSLPPVQPLADPNSIIAKRCFLVFKPSPPPFDIVKDVFCRFGDLISITLFKNKTFGYAKYASVRAAQEAIDTLHGATLYGIQMKVLEAEEKSKNDDFKIDDNDDEMDNDGSRKWKRIKN